MKEMLMSRLSKVMEKISTKDILEARENRNWEAFDKLTELEKLQCRLEEFEIFEDIFNL